MTLSRATREDKPKMRHIKELWQAVAIYSSMAQFTLISVLGHPYKKETVVLSFGQTCFQLLLAIL